VITLGSISAVELASAFDTEHQALSSHNTESERALRRKYSALLRTAPPAYLLDFARALFFRYGHRWQAYEVIAGHKAAFHSLNAELLEEFGQGINSWRWIHLPVPFRVQPGEMG
jgi:hypothetical protein